MQSRAWQDRHMNRQSCLRAITLFGTVTQPGQPILEILPPACETRVDAGAPLWQRDDLQAVGIVLLEMMFSALAEDGPSQATSADALKRLLLEVFTGDVERFRLHPSLKSLRTVPDLTQSLTDDVMGPAEGAFVPLV